MTVRARRRLLGARPRGRVVPRSRDHTRAAQACRCSARPPTTSRRRRPRAGVVVAVVCGALFGAIAARFDDSWALPAYLVLAAALVALSVIDLEHYLLPNRIVYPLAGAMLVLLAVASLGDGDFDAYLRAAARRRRSRSRRSSCCTWSRRAAWASAT